MSTILTFLTPSLMNLSICKCAFTQTHIFAYQISFLMKSETQDCRKYTNIQMGLFIYIYYPTAEHTTTEIDCYYCDDDSRLCFLVSL